jgi:hypothetical protein
MTTKVRVTLKQVKAAERSYSSALMASGPHDMAVQRLEFTWRDLVRKYEAQTGKPLYTLKNPKRRRAKIRNPRSRVKAVPKTRRIARKQNPDVFATGTALARSALAGAYSAKRSRNTRLLQAKVSYAQGVIEALHKVAVMTTTQAKMYLAGLRDLLK